MKKNVIGTMVLAFIAVVAQVVYTSAASYAKTTLRDMTVRASAVAEVTVLSRSYPAIKGNEFPRTHVEVTVNRTLKGSLPATITLDLPGAVHGNQVWSVADSANFELNERALVFIKEPTPGQYMMQDLGLGKFNLVTRENATFVESSVCPKAMQGAGDDLEASLLTKSIPYNDFCKLVSAYSMNEEPAVNPMKLAMILNNNTHTCKVGQPCEHNALLSEGLRNVSAAAQTHNTLSLALTAAFIVICAAVAVMLRRNARKAVRSNAKSIALILTAALVAGGAIGGTFSFAYIASGPVWNLDDTANPKISGSKVVYKTSAPSKTNANSFDGVNASFQQWGSVQNSRLGFVNGGTTTLQNHAANDGVNFITWEADPSSDFSKSTLAITYSYYTLGGKSFYIDGDLVFNDRDFNWAPGGNGNTKSVSLHEIGHFIGLQHSNSQATVMYPYDGGLTNLTNDELTAAQNLYPGSNTGTTVPPVTNTPPIASVSGSPVSGPAPLNSFLDAGSSVAGSSAIVSYAWNFGDGSTGTGKTLNHTFATGGSFTVTVTVTDEAGLTSNASLTVTVSGPSEGTPPSGGGVDNPPAQNDNTGSLLRGSFKLVFPVTGRDTFVGLFYSQNAASFVQKARAATGRADGTLMIGDARFNFSLDSLTLKGYGDGGMKVQLSGRTGILTVSLKSANLKDAIIQCGAQNATGFGNVDVPVAIVFGNGADLAIKTDAHFFYKAIANKAATGKY